MKMLIITCCFLTCILIPYVSSVQVTNCGGVPVKVSLWYENGQECLSSTCDLVQGSMNSIQVDFTAPSDSNALRSQAQGKIAGLNINWPGFDRDACNNKGISCPVKAGQEEWKYYEWIPRSTSNRYSSVPGGLPAYQDMWGSFKSIAHSIGGRPIHGHSINGHHLSEFEQLDDWEQLFRMPMPVPTGFKWIISSDPEAFDTNFMVQEPLRTVEQVTDNLNYPIGPPMGVPSIPRGYSNGVRVRSPLETIQGHVYKGREPTQSIVPVIVNKYNYPADVYHHPYK